MASAELKKALEDGKQEPHIPGVMRETAVPPPERSSPWSKGHCDFLLDRIDAQLSPTQGPRPRIKGSCGDGPPTLGATGATSSRTDPRRGNAGVDRDLPSQKVDRRGRLLYLPDSKDAPSKSDSICTEDLAAEFQKGLVDLLLSSDEDEAVSALALCPRDARPLASGAAGLSGNAGPSSPFRSLSAALDSRTLDLASKQLPAEASKEKWSREFALRSREAPLQSLAQHGVRSVESLGEKVSALRQKCSAKTSSGTDVGRGGQPRNRNLHPRLQSSRGKGGISREGGFLESQRGGKGLERRRSIPRSISHWVLVEDPLPSWPVARRSTSKIRVPPRTAEVCPPEKASSEPPAGGITQPGPLGGACRSGSWPFGGEDEGQLILYPPEARLLGSRQRLAPSELGMDPGVIYAPKDAQKPPGWAGGRRKTRAVALSNEVCDEVPERGETDGHNVKKPLLPPKDSWRSSGSCISGADEEEFAKLSTQSRWSSGNFRRWAPNWKEATAGNYSPNQTTSRTGWHPADAPTEDGVAKLRQLEESIQKREQDSRLEDEKLLQKKAQIQAAEASLRGILQQKKHVALELETFQAALQERQELVRRLELHTEEHRDKVDEARADLVLLEYKREVCLKDVWELEQELSVLRRQGSQYGALQVEVSRLVSEREELKNQVRCLEDQLSSLKFQLKSSRAKLSSMEEMASEKTKQLQEALLSEKELEIERMRKTLLVSEAEKEALDSAIRSLKEEHGQRLERLQQEASREKEKELCQLREEMQLEKKQALQEFAESLEEAKASALQEQAVTFQKEIENLRKVIEEREADVIQQQEAIHQQAVALKLEAKEMVQNALLREQKKWEANTQAALQMQREALGEQDRRKWVDLQRVLEKEKKLNSALRKEAADLRRKVQGLENQAHLFEGEKRASLEELQAVLQKEKAEALRRLREELEQERRQERDQLRARLQQLEGEQQRLQAEHSQMSLREQEAQAQADRADRCLATQVVLACRQLQDLLPKKAVLLPHMLYRGTIPLSSGAALQALQEVGAEIQSYVQDLNHELEMQRQCIFRNQREKELEMRQQEERLRLESQSVLEALKEQLVQEHLKDIITLQRSWLKEGQVKDKRVFCPQQEGRAGDLHTAQKKVAHGKDEADPTSISEPKEDLDREPESLPCRYPSSNVCKNLATPGSEGGHFSTGWSRRLPPRSLCPPSLNASQSHRAAPRLPHHLQDRVWKLRAENSVYSAGTLGSFHEGWRPLALEHSLSGLRARNSREQHRPRTDLTAST
ncbi:uncharacterized protein PHA67_005268 [Liasis olivaceus]